MDVEAIMKIPLSRHITEDTHAWAYERNGFYSVRSAYRLLKDVQVAVSDHSNRNASGSGGPGIWWKHLWKMKVPPKVRVFWWRAINNFLPARRVLKHRHISKESHCFDCGHPNETIFHTMFESTYARRFWECIKDIVSLKPPKLHPDTWAKDLLVGNFCKEEDVALIVCCCWSLWTGRNSRNHGNAGWNPNAVAKFVTKMVEDVLNIHEKEARQMRVVHTWKTPPHGFLKLNVDGAFNETLSRVGTGAIIRDAQGKMLRAQARWYDQLEDAMMAEALAIRDGLELAKDVGYRKIWVESDNISVVKLMNELEGFRSPLASIWHDVQELRRSFSHFPLDFVNREANVAAHCCAKFANPVNRDVVWVSCAPGFLLDVLVRDYIQNE